MLIYKQELVNTKTAIINLDPIKKLCLII